MNDRIRTGYLVLAVLVTWAGLGMQIYLFHHWALNHQMGLIASLLNFLSFFTNLANLLAGATLLYALRCALAGKQPGIDARRMTDIAIYICMAGIVFNLELRHLVPPDGLVYATNVILHDFSPLLFLVYWWVDCPPNLRFSQAYTCLLFPTLYFAYVIGRGHLTGRYPYPFFDVEKVGYLPVIQTGLEMLAGFMVMGLALVALNRLKIRYQSK